MAYVYLPSDYINNCNVVHDGYIRSYTDNTYTQWVDIFIGQDYMVQAGSSSTAESVVCDTLNIYTTDEKYKLNNDYTDFFVFGIGILFALFLLQIRRFDRNESA